MFNDQELRIQLLLKLEVLKNICSWQGCKKSIAKFSFCESHAYLEMGIRKVISTAANKKFCSKRGRTIKL